MDINNLSVDQLVEYVNAELEKGRTLKDIEVEDFIVNPRVIGKRLGRKGYKRVDDRYIEGDKTSSTTTPGTLSESNNLELGQVDNTSSITLPGTLKNIDLDKLNLLFILS